MGSLSKVHSMNGNDRVKAFALVNEAMELQLSDDCELQEAEARLVKALELAPNCLEALQEAAHFYDSVVPQIEKAKNYATLCKELCQKIMAEMDEIIAETSN